MTITPEQIAEWRETSRNALATPLWEYCPTEFWQLLDAYEQAVIDCDNAVENECEWQELATYEIGGCPYLWKNRALQAEASHTAARENFITMQQAGLVLVRKLEDARMALRAIESLPRHSREDQGEIIAEITSIASRALLKSEKP